jgi:hypothetical protein
MHLTEITMKSATPFWFGALLVASTGLLYCGGDDTSTPGTGTGDTSGSGGSGSNATTGTTGITVGTTATTGGGPVTTATTTTGGSGGNPTGGAGGAATTGGGGGTGGRGGGGVGGSKAGGGGTGGAGGAGPVIDAGACPNNRPMNGGNCATATQVCSYPTGDCTCEEGGGMLRDGGPRNGWMCVNIVPDGGGRGGGGDAPAGCPNNPPNNGNICPNNAGDVCPYTFRGGALTCSCAPGRGGVDRWDCVLGDGG